VTLRARIEHLRSPHSGLLGQLLRFGLAGSIVAIVYIALTTLLYKVFGVPFQVALVVGFSAGLLLHFTLQRVFVWIHHDEFALPLNHQVGRYLAIAAAQYGLTAASTGSLPSTLGVDTEVVYLVTMALVTTGGFLLMRFVIFHAERDAEASSVAPPSSSPRRSTAAGDQPVPLASIRDS
jgi:putative flippase GtrA